MFKDLDTARRTIVARIPQYEAAANVASTPRVARSARSPKRFVDHLLDAGILVKNA